MHLLPATWPTFSTTTWDTQAAATNSQTVNKKTTGLHYEWKLAMEKHVSLPTSAKCILIVPEAAPPIEYIDSTYSIVDSDARGHKIFEMRLLEGHPVNHYWANATGCYHVKL